MCNFMVPETNGSVKDVLYVGIFPPTECATACDLAKYSKCGDPIGQGSPWMPVNLDMKSDFRKMIQKAALAKKILIYMYCLHMDRKSVFQEHNWTQHVKAQNNLGHTRDRDLLVF